MGFFDAFKKNVMADDPATIAKNLGERITEGGGKIVENALEKARDTKIVEVLSDVSVIGDTKRKLHSLENKLRSINTELDASFAIIGKRFYERFIKKSTEEVDINDVVLLLEPKLKEKEQIEDEIAKLERELQQLTALREKYELEKRYEAEKAKLDKALKMGVINQQEYDEKIRQYRSAVDSYDEVKRINQQFDMGIIGEEERDYKIKRLMDGQA